MELGFSGAEGGLLFYKRKEILILFFLFFENGLDFYRYNAIYFCCILVNGMGWWFIGRLICLFVFLCVIGSRSPFVQNRI